MITATSADGTDIRAFDDGHGRAILVVHPGHVRAPDELARVIETVADKVLR
jgi:hypothetical protein